MTIRIFDVVSTFEQTFASAPASLRPKDCMIRRDADETGPPPTVLLVDDDSALRTLLYRFLNEGGYNVLGAANGVDALAICHQFRRPIALLLTDVDMPGMTGFELAEQVHAIRPDMRILIMSGRGASSPKGWCSALTIVAKPFNSAMLITTIKQELCLSNDVR